MGIGRNRAFTLLELILVLVILSAGAALVVPRFGGVAARQRLRAAACELMSISGRARAEASALALRYRLVLDAEERKYWVERESEPLSEPNEFSLVPRSWARVRELPRAMEFEQVDYADEELAERREEAGSFYVEFRPDGTADPVVIYVASEAGDRIALQIEEATGRATVRAAEEEPLGSIL